MSSCTNFSGIISGDQHFSNLTVTNLTNVCELVTRKIESQQEVITLEEIPTETAVYNITPIVPLTIVTFSDVLRNNINVTINIDNTHVKLGYEVVFIMQALILDDGGDPLAVQINTLYPTYWFGNDWSNANIDNSYLVLPAGINYDETDPPNYVPGRLRFSFFYDGQCWTNTINIAG